ncbi:MAG: cyanobactin biosynthesis system PatB/AcyB/McaB family protein [Rivularia sp. (in: cyanobacteria)]
MRLPYLSPPVKRPHFVQPASAVDVENGRVEDLVHIRMDLLHGANYNDPAAFEYRSYNQVMCSTLGGGGFAGMARGRFY